MVNDLSSGVPIGKSHHATLTFTFSCYVTESPTMSHYILYKGDYDNMRKDTKSIDWDSKFIGDIEHDCLEIMREINRLTDEYIPKSRPQYKQKKLLYLTNRVFEKLRTKKQAFQKWRNSHSSSDYKNYAKARNQAKNECRIAERDFERKLANEAKSNPKAFFKYAQSKIKTRSTICDLMKSDGTLTTTDGEKADALNTYFASVFTDEDISQLPSFNSRHFIAPLHHIEVTRDMIIKKIDNLKTNKSAGPDGIYPRVLKELKLEIVCPLLHLYSSSLREGKLPQIWKLGHVSPLFKKGNKHLVNNYRPISLTSIICKLIESIIKDSIVSHLEQNALIVPSQHGFIKGRSCVTQLTEVLDIWSNAIDHSSSIDALYLDFAKAFDSVPHKRLLLKLEKYGIHGNLLKWIEDFLTNRAQRVVVNGCKSVQTPVISGVPQGSVLGPLLFICYINDLPDVIKCSTINMFADDTKIYKEIKSSIDAIELQDDLNSVTKWSSIWQIKFNADKCCAMHLGTANIKHSYFMNSLDTNIKLVETTVVKDLGLNVDNQLKFSIHCQIQVSKANKILGLIRRSLTHLDSSTLVRLYTSLVRPILEYGNGPWTPMLKKDSLTLENVQRRATKMIPSIRNYTYLDRLKYLNLPSLYYRRSRGDMIQTYKYIHGLYRVQCPFLEIDKQSITRGHNFKLTKSRSNKLIRQNFFANRITNSWNSLPNEVVSSVSLNIFKNKLDSFWSDFLYTQEPVHNHYLSFTSKQIN
jgi:predicted transcriptional regulator